MVWVDTIPLDKELALLGRADCRVDCDTEVISQLNGGLANTTCSGVDKHGLALAQLAQVHECMVGRGVHDRHRGCFLEAHCVRNLAADNLVSAEGGCVGANTASSNAVTDLDARNSGADGPDNTTDFQTQEGIVENAHGGHDITEVDTGCLDLDVNLAVTEWLAHPPVVRDELQGIQQTGLADGETQRAIVLLERHDTRPVLEVVADISVLLVIHAETRHHDGAVLLTELSILGVGAQDAASQSGTGLEAGGGGQVQYIESGADNFTTNDPSQTIDHVEVGLVTVGEPEKALGLENDFAESKEVSLGYFVQDHLLHLKDLALGGGNNVLGVPGDTLYSVLEAGKDFGKLAGEGLGGFTSLRRLNDDNLRLGLNTVGLCLSWVGVETITKDGSVPLLGQDGLRSLLRSCAENTGSRLGQRQSLTQVLFKISHALASRRHNDQVCSGNVRRSRCLGLAEVEDIHDSLALGLGHGITDLAGQSGSIRRRSHSALGYVGGREELDDSSSRVSVEEHVGNLGSSLHSRDTLSDLLDLLRSGELHAVVPADSRAQVARLGLLAGLNWLLGCGRQFGGAEVPDLKVHLLELLIQPVDLSSSILETVALGCAEGFQGSADISRDISRDLKLAHNSGDGSLVDVKLLVISVGTTDPRLEDSIKHGRVDEEGPVDQLVAVGWATVLQDDIVELVAGISVRAGFQDALVVGDLALGDVSNLRLHLSASLSILDGHQTASVVTERLITASAGGDGPLPPGMRVRSGSGDDVWADVGDDLSGGVIAHWHGAEEGHIAELERADCLSGVGHLLGGLEDHGDHTSSREKNHGEDLVLTDPGLVLKREEPTPHMLVLVHHGHRSANKRLAGFLSCVVVEIQTALGAERLGVVPRVRGKISELLAFDVLVDSHDLERSTLAEQVGSKVEGSLDTVLATLQDRGVGNVLAAACSIENLLNGTTKSRVRAEFDQQVDGWLGDRVGERVCGGNKLHESLGEKDGADKVADPVVRAKLLGIDFVASNGRDHPGSLLSRTAALNVVTHDLVHVLGVVGDLNLQLTSKDLLLVEHWQQLVETSDVTRDSNTFGGVDASNTNLASIDLGNPLLSFLTSKTDSHHASVEVASLGLNQRRRLATEVSSCNGILVAQSTNCVCRAHLTGRVTNALGRCDSPGTKLINQGNLEDSADGLGDLRMTKARLLARAPQLLSRVPFTTTFFKILRGLGDGLAEGLALGAVLGKAGGLPAQLRAALTKGVGKVGDVLRVGSGGTKGVEVVGQCLANTLQTSLVGSGESEETLLVHDRLLRGEDGAARSRAVGQERVTLALVYTLEDYVGVGASHSERGDRHTLHISNRPGSKLLRHVDVPLVERNTLVQLVEVNLGRNHAVLHSQDTLDQTSNSSTSFQVTDVGLDRTNNDLARGGGLRTKSFVDGPDFHRVTSLGTSTVALHELCALHVETEVLVDITNESRLGLRARESNTLGPTIRVDTGTPDDSSDWVTVTLGVCQLLDQDDTATLTTTVPITIVVEGSAVTERRQETEVAELHSNLRVQDQVHTTSHSHIGLSVAYTLASQVDGDQRRRASCLNSHRRTMDVKVVADSVGENLVRHTSQGVLGRIFGVTLDGSLVVGQTSTDVDSSLATLDLLIRHTSGLEGLVSYLEGHTLSRVHSNGLRGGEVEEGGIKSEDVIFEEVTTRSGNCTEGALVGMVKSLGPAVGGWGVGICKLKMKRVSQ
ncbi:hypothetical protein VM1G_11595 [Cytospora mali]|uniref:Uncharacterized protein n=1 Tax=Cytospora mali TaxID=578113 RepID=A0A194VZI5_CYTMA|nr:hypothetical protein VM1G_11595 [Valsa mali]